MHAFGCGHVHAPYMLRTTATVAVAVAGAPPVRPQAVPHLQSLIHVPQRIVQWISFFIHDASMYCSTCTCTWAGGKETKEKKDEEEKTRGLTSPQARRLFGPVRLCRRMAVSLVASPPLGPLRYCTAPPTLLPRDFPSPILIATANHQKPPPSCKSNSLGE